ncbi:hypothetical protein Tsubulata_028494 [Turnera subulata]|uniref:Mitochondrial import inner membrane translocase subunit TIM50 n=1 Tax=Turnera subulata TaxID=218843 RepID=A0A9Q0FS45_9ROSI|nr:hypothetical protein Tsubulata_028494 [Turnera subulata]
MIKRHILFPSLTRRRSRPFPIPLAFLSFHPIPSRFVFSSLRSAIMEETSHRPLEVPVVVHKRKVKNRRRRKRNNNNNNNKGDVIGSGKLNQASASLLSDAGETEVVVCDGGICNKENVPPASPSRAPVRNLKKKLLILDLNGVLVDIVSRPPKNLKADVKVSGQAVFRRPFCHDFLKFCFERFEDLSKCTATQFRTLENKHKVLVLKDLRKIWEKYDPELPWEKGYYNESNTLLLDDSPYKALLNPVCTAIFPFPYHIQIGNDSSLDAGGNLRVYLEELAAADNVQKFVQLHPFGQPAISEISASWCFYSKVISSLCASQQ